MDLVMKFTFFFGNQSYPAHADNAHLSSATFIRFFCVPVSNLHFMIENWVSPIARNQDVEHKNKS